MEKSIRIGVFGLLFCTLLSSLALSLTYSQLVEQESAERQKLIQKIRVQKSEDLYIGSDKTKIKTILAAKLLYSRT